MAFNMFFNKILFLLIGFCFKDNDVFIWVTKSQNNLTKQSKYIILTPHVGELLILQ
jgi:NAD(P)H-hydrate repair Nnr-like enzyme with NAD(P)H-hydrate dehydratase domain